MSHQIDDQDFDLKKGKIYVNEYAANIKNDLEETRTNLFKKA